MSYKLKTTYPSPKNRGRLLQTRGIVISILVILFRFSGWASDTIFQRLPDPRLWDTTFMAEVFSDHFEGGSLNRSVWHVEDCEGRGNIPSNNEGGPGNIEVSNGKLKLAARYFPGNQDINCWSGGFTSNYTTSEIYSINNRYLFGSFEAMCKMPAGKGLFFAFWLWGKGDVYGFPKDEWASEIDIAEKIFNNVIHAFHYWPPEGPETPILKAVKRTRVNPGRWHLYKVIWTPYVVEFYVDGKKTWEKTRFFAGSESRRNRIHQQQIRTGEIYQVNDWFPRHACGTVFQMQLNSDIVGREQKLLPAVMEVDYVKVKQFFQAPAIICPDTVTSYTLAILDVDPRASVISWSVAPTEYFSGSTEGTGNLADISVSGNREGTARIVWSFQMPSGEKFKTQKEFRVGIP
jgi:beta-glucanase (GH16 family)